MSKRKLAAIIVACAIAIIVAIVLFSVKPWERTPSAETYRLTTIVSPSGAGSVSPSGGEYESGDQVTLTASPASGYNFDYWSGNASGNTSTITITMDSDRSVTAHFETIPTGPEEPEPEIPAHFTTYTDELGLFSISYPPEWEVAPEYMEEYGLLLIAGLPEGFNPNVSISAQPVPVITWTHDEAVAATIELHKGRFPDYHEFSRVETTIDNRTATIIEFQGTIAESDTYRYVHMITLVGETGWFVICTTLPDDYSEWENDFDAIVRSFRILK